MIDLTKTELSKININNTVEIDDLMIVVGIMNKRLKEANERGDYWYKHFLEVDASFKNLQKTLTETIAKYEGMICPETYPKNCNCGNCESECKVGGTDV
jgi:hypothetical protein